MQLMIAEDGKKLLHSGRIDQLLHLLMKVFQEYYLYKLHCKQIGCTSNPALEKRVKEVCQHADQIHESSVQLPEQSDGAALVKKDLGIIYHVTSPGSAEASCDCMHFLRGEICKHIMKVSRPPQ